MEILSKPVEEMVGTCGLEPWTSTVSNDTKCHHFGGSTDTAADTSPGTETKLWSVSLTNAMILGITQSRTTIENSSRGFANL